MATRTLIKVTANHANHIKFCKSCKICKEESVERIA
jgi:hypothetical protein